MIKFCLLLCTLAIAVNGLSIERIIGGHDAPNHNYPHQVSFRERVEGIRDLHFCSGAILNEKWIVTAAHCFQGRDTSNVAAVVGTNYLSEWGDGSYGIEFHVIPAGYVNFYYNNICLVRVKGEMRLSDIVQPIGLPVADLPSGNPRAFLSGWGNTRGDGGSPLVIDGHLVGIVSYRYVECARGYPDVFTRVWSFIAWIQATMEKDKISS